MVKLRANLIVTAASIFLLGACFSFIALGGAWARPSLKQAVLAMDGKYLKAYAYDPIDHTVEIKAGGDTLPRIPAEISQRGVTARLSYDPPPSNDRDAGPVPVVTVYYKGHQVAQLKNEESGSQYEFFVQLAEIDSSNDTPEVVLTYYTGGAHCCSSSHVVTDTPQGWKTVDIGDTDGGAVPAQDINGDGRYEFETTDGAFHYAFGCYACSTAPLKILTVQNGVLQNVSAAPRYRKQQAAWMRGIVKSARNDDPNAYLAGYVAEKILLGEGPAAWRLMLRYYDRRDKDGLKICTEPLTKDYKCPIPEKTFTYPQALAYTLRTNGYPVPR